MAGDPEARTQLARLLGDERLRSAPIEVVREAVDEQFDLLVDGLVAETAASDDVMDRETGLSFARLRVDALQAVLSESQAIRLYEAVRGKIEAW